MVCSGVVFLNALRFFLFFYLVGGKAGEADDLAEPGSFSQVELCASRSDGC